VKRGKNMHKKIICDAAYIIQQIHSIAGIKPEKTAVQKIMGAKYSEKDKKICDVIKSFCVVKL